MNNMTNDQCEFTEMLPGYVCGTLTKGEAEKVKGHLATCTICQAEMKAPKPLAVAVKMATDALPGPPSDLISSTMKRVAADKTMKRVAADKIDAEVAAIPAEALSPTATHSTPAWRAASEEAVSLNSFHWRKNAQNRAASMARLAFANAGTLTMVLTCLVLLLGSTLGASYFAGQAKGMNQAENEAQAFIKEQQVIQQAVIDRQKATIDEQKKKIEQLESENLMLRNVARLPLKPVAKQPPRPADTIIGAFEGHISTVQPTAYTTGFSLPLRVTTAVIKVVLADGDSLAENGRITITSRDGRQIALENLQNQGRILLLQVDARSLTPGWYNLTIDLNTKGMFGGVKPKPFFSNFLVSHDN